jgi:2-hydroxy-6-oxonona-2,4-dienedioate hydrolase
VHASGRSSSESLQAFGPAWLDVDGTRTRYFATPGARTPVVLVHGGTIGEASAAANADDWSAVFRALNERGYPCIAFDKLGQGYTDNPRTRDDWSMRGQVRHAIAVLRALARGPYDLVGHSRGGYVACQVTIEAPELVRSCVIVDSNTTAPGAGRNDYLNAHNTELPGSPAAIRTQHILESFGADHVTAEWLAHKHAIVHSEKHQAANAAMRAGGLFEEVFAPFLRADRDALFARLEREAFPRPLFLIWGYNDPPAPLGMAHRLYDLVVAHAPRTQLHILNEAGHYSFREQTRAFVRVVDEFLRGVDAGE